MTWSNILSGIISGIISGCILSLSLNLLHRRKNLKPEVIFVDGISFHDGKYRIKFLNNIIYPIAITSSKFILSYRKNSNTNNDNYRYKLTIPGESISYINPKADDKDGDKLNEKTYATVVINAQTIDQRTIENSNVSQSIQTKYLQRKKWEKMNQNNVGEKESNENPHCLTIEDFFIEDSGATIIAVLQIVNLDNQQTGIAVHSFSKGKIQYREFEKGRSLKFRSEGE